MTANLNSAPDPHRRELLAVLALVAAILSLSMIASCSPRIVEHIVHQRDTTYIERLQIDSVFKRDSVYVREKEDTVYIFQERVRERYKFVHDTVSLVRIDSVAFETVKEVEVVQPLTWWQTARIRAFWYLLAGLSLALLWIFRKPILTLLKL